MNYFRPLVTIKISGYLILYQLKNYTYFTYLSLYYKICSEPYFWVNKHCRFFHVSLYISTLLLYCDHKLKKAGV